MTGGRAVLAILILTALAACSAAGGVSPPVSQSANARAPAGGKLLLRIRLPKKSHARRFGPRYISAATKGLTMAFAGPQTLTEAVDLTPADPRCSGTPLVCTITIGLRAGAYAATVDTYDQAPVDGAIPAGAKLLSSATNVAVTIQRGALNNVGLTLDGVPAGIVFGSIAPAATGSGFLFRSFSVTVSDAAGYTIVGTYSAPVTLTDSDTSGATAITTSGSDDPPVGVLLSSSDTAALSYSGKAIVAATIAARAGAAAGSTIFDVFLPIYVADTGNNKVKQIPPECGSANCITTLGGGFNQPQGIAVDTSATVFVADYGNNAVKQIPAGCFATGCVTAIGGGFLNPFTVAVDAADNVFVADYGNNLVKKVPAGCTTAACVVTLGGGFDFATGVAVDASDNVYVADTFDNVVKEMPASCLSSSCVTKLAGGAAFSLPTGVTVDGAGDVFVLETFSSSASEIPAGCDASSCVTSLSGGFNGPYGIAADWFGDLLVADTGNGVAKLVPPGCNASPCVTTFATGFNAPYGIAVLDIP